MKERGFFELDSVDEAFTETCAAMQEMGDEGGRIVAEVKSPNREAAAADLAAMSSWQPPRGWTRTYANARCPNRKTSPWITQVHFANVEYLVLDALKTPEARSLR